MTNKKNVPVLFDASRHALAALLDSSRKALAKAESLGDFKSIGDGAEILKRCAAQVGCGLEAQNTCAEIKIRAERGGGEFLLNLDSRGGGRPKKNSSHNATNYQKAIEEAGVSKDTAHRWQQEAAVPESRFEEYVSKVMESGTELTSGGFLRVAILEGWIGRKGGKKPGPIPKGKFSVIYADPPWRFENRVPSRAVERHYSSMSLEDIKAISKKISGAYASGVMLFLWVPISMLPEGLEVMGAWGFKYKTNIIWDKQKLGLGWFVRSCHEHLLIGVRGKVPTPDEKDRPRSIFRASPNEMGKHSSKPNSVYGMINKMCPGAKKLELFSRVTDGAENQEKHGWKRWGNESLG